MCAPVQGWRPPLGRLLSDTLALRLKGKCLVLRGFPLQQIMTLPSSPSQITFRHSHQMCGPFWISLNTESDKWGTESLLTSVLPTSSQLAPEPNALRLLVSVSVSNQSRNQLWIL